MSDLLAAFAAAVDRAREDRRRAVHNHAPYRPVCNERHLPDGRLRGACLNDDGSPVADLPTNPSEES